MNASAQSILEIAEGAPPSMVEAVARVLRSGKQPVQAAFLARSLNALARLVAEVDEKALGDAAGALSDYAALLRALEEPSVLHALRAEDSLAPARLRGLCFRERLLQAEGGTLSAPEVAALLGISRQAVDKRRRAGRLIGLRLGRHGYAYPAWQFETQGTLRGLERVLDELRDHDAWMQVAFMVNANSRLDGESPLAVLRKGNLEPVIQAARSYGTQGAP